MSEGQDIRSSTSFCLPMCPVLIHSFFRLSHHISWAIDSTTATRNSAFRFAAERVAGDFNGVATASTWPMDAKIAAASTKPDIIRGAFRDSHTQRSDAMGLAYYMHFFLEF